MVWDISSQITRHWIFIYVNGEILSISVLGLVVWRVEIFLYGKKLLEQILSRNWEVGLWELKFMRLMLESPIRYMSLFSLDFFSGIGIKILLNSCVVILGCFYMLPIIDFFLFLLMISVNIDSSSFARSFSNINEHGQIKKNLSNFKLLCSTKVVILKFQNQPDLNQKIHQSNVCELHFEPWLWKFGIK